MKALGGREAKRKIALARAGGVEPCDGSSQHRGDLACPLARRQFLGGCQMLGERTFDGHIGIHEGVQTVRDNMTDEAADLRVSA